MTHRGPCQPRTSCDSVIQVNTLQSVGHRVFTTNKVQAEKTAHLTSAFAPVSVSNFAHMVAAAVTLAGGLGWADALVASTEHVKQLKCVHTALRSALGLFSFETHPFSS